MVGEGYLYAEGTTPAELQAVESAGELCRGATAYLNMEPGDTYGDHTAVSALINVCTVLLCISQSFYALTICVERDIFFLIWNNYSNYAIFLFELIRLELD